MVNLGRPPLLLNKPYRWPFNYLEYVKDSDPYAHIKEFKVAIIAYSETNDAKTVYDWHNNYMGDYPNCTFGELQLVFCKRYKRV